MTLFSEHPKLSEVSVTVHMSDGGSWTLCRDYPGILPEATPTSLLCDLPVRGRIVKVTQNKLGSLRLCEVEVYDDMSKFYTFITP